MMEFVYGLIAAVGISFAMMPVAYAGAWLFMVIGDWAFDRIAAAQEWQRRKGWM